LRREPRKMSRKPPEVTRGSIFFPSLRTPGKRRKSPESSSPHGPHGQVDGNARKQEGEEEHKSLLPDQKRQR